MRTPTTPRPRRAALVLAAGALLATGATACEPPPPPTAFAVAVTASGPDTTPGDGECANADGRCSLQAAVEEANALGAPTTLSVPDGLAPPVELEVTGALTLEAAGTWQDLQEVRFTVAEDAQLEISDADVHSVSVDGSLSARRVRFSGWEAEIPIPEVILEVGPAGRALLTNAEVVGWLGRAADVSGTAVLFHTTVLLADGAAHPDRAAVTTREGGETRLIASAFLGGSDAAPTCAGETPTSYGYNLAPDTTCGLTMEGDAQDFEEGSIEPEEGSRRIDVVPAGTHQCGTGLTDDLTSPDRGRPLDGDEDGTPGCDAGAVER